MADTANSNTTPTANGGGPGGKKKKQQRLIAVAAGGVGLLYLMHRGHSASQSGVSDTGSSDPASVSGEIVPVAASGPGFASPTTPQGGGLSIGGDVNSPLYPSTVAGGSPDVVGTGNLTDPQAPVNFAGPGSENPTTTTTTDTISPVAPAAAANTRAAAKPKGHPGYKHPARHKAKPKPRPKAPARKPEGRAPVHHAPPRRAPRPAPHRAPPPRRPAPVRRPPSRRHR